MKKVIFGVLAMIFAIALVVGGYILFVSPDLQEYVVEEGVSCPYSWQELRDGSYRLEIDPAAYSDYNWNVESYPKNVLAATEVSGDSEHVVFSILPLNEGQAYLQVYCEQTAPFAVRGFEVGMNISVSEERTITVEKTEHKEHGGITVMGEDSDYPIQWWTDSDGIVSLLVEEENGDKWEPVGYDPAGITISGPFYRQGSCGFEIQGNRAGAFPLIISNGSDRAIYLEIKVAEDLGAAVTRFTVDVYAVDRSEDHAELENEVGIAVVLPQQAVETNYSIKSKRGYVEFLMNDLEWRWQISADETVEEIVGSAAEDASETERAVIGNTALSAYGFSDGVIVVWSDRDCSMALYGRSGTSVSEALAVAGQIVEANNG